MTRSGTLAADNFNNSSVVNFKGDWDCRIQATKIFSDTPLLWSSTTLSTVGGPSCAEISRPTPGRDSTATSINTAALQFRVRLLTCAKHMSASIYEIDRDSELQAWLTLSPRRYRRAVRCAMLRREATNAGDD